MRSRLPVRGQTRPTMKRTELGFELDTNLWETVSVFSPRHPTKLLSLPRHSKSIVCTSHRIRLQNTKHETKKKHEMRGLRHFAKGCATKIHTPAAPQLLFFCNTFRTPNRMLDVTAWGARAYTSNDTLKQKKNGCNVSLNAIVRWTACRAGMDAVARCCTDTIDVTARWI